MSTSCPSCGVPDGQLHKPDCMIKDQFLSGLGLTEKKATHQSYALDERSPPARDSTFRSENKADPFRGIASDPTWVGSEADDWLGYFRRVYDRWPHGQFGRAIRFVLDNLTPPIEPPSGNPYRVRFETEARAHEDTLQLWAADKRAYETQLAEKENHRAINESSMIAAQKERDLLAHHLTEAHAKQDSLRATIRALAPFADFFEVIKQITTR